MRPLQLHGHERPLTRVIYNREGDLIFSAARDKSANAWFSHSGERLGSYDGHNGAIFDLHVDYDSKILATGSGDNTAKLWSVSEGKCLHSWEFPTSVRSVQFSLGDAQLLILTDTRKDNPGRLHFFNIDKTQAEPQSVIISGSRATIARWGNLNKVVYTGHDDGTVMMWEPLSGMKVASRKVHSDAITDLQVSSDFSFIVTSSKDCFAKIIDAESLEDVKVYQSDRPLNSATSSPLFEQILVGGGQEARDVTTTSAKAGKFEVCFYHRIYEQEIGRLRAHFSPINTLAFHPSGKSFASGAEEGYVRIYHFDDDYYEYQFD